MIIAYIVGFEYDFWNFDFVFDIRFYRIILLPVTRREEHSGSSNCPQQFKLFHIVK